ncbi:MAG: hypothetical protein HRT72_03360, partial [Flavobacteriales bacterium]|nr:hypothetical protein [Flavobacteriales bacterium]
KFFLLNTVNGIFWTFMHAYLGAILASFIIAYVIVKITPNILKKNINWKFYALLIGQSLIPLIVYLVFVRITDVHLARTSNPYGFFSYCADMESVFLPSREPLAPFFKSILPKYGQEWEGVSYVGIVSILTLILIIYGYIKKSLTKSPSNLFDNYFNSPHLRNMLIASFIVLMFSMAYPFRWGMRELIDYLGFIKQFRSPGRFAWVFFLVVNVLAITIIDKIINEAISNKKKTLGYFLLVLTFFIYGKEGYSFHKIASKQITKSENVFDKSQLTESYSNVLAHIDPDRFQAILPFPFYCIGSENFGLEGSNQSSVASKIISFHTSLPIMAAHSARGSILESKKLMQILTPNFYEKKIQDDILSNKEFLIVCTKEQIGINEKRILNKATPLYEEGEIHLFSILKEDLFGEENTASINEFNNIKDSLLYKNGFLSTDSSLVLYNDFDDQESNITFRGKGAYSGDLKGWHNLALIPNSDMVVGIKYEFRFWMYCGGKNGGQDMLAGIVAVASITNGKESWISTKGPRNSETIVGDWVMIEIEFEYKDSNSDIKLIIK